MKVKNKLFVFALILSLMFSIGCISAQENITFDQSESEPVSIETNEIDTETVNGNEATDNPTDDYEVVTPDQGLYFSDIQDKIDHASEGDTIFLDGTYYTGNATIKVNKQLTIIGGTNEDDNSYSTLDAKEQSRIMEITASNVIIKGIVFVKGYVKNIDIIENWGQNTLPGEGAAIYINGANCSVDNCRFDNNYAQTSGGAIFINSANCIINNSNFENNFAREGGAIFANADDAKILNSNFTDNDASSAAAIEARGKNFLVANGYFNNNKVHFDGGAIRYYGSNTIITNSTFVNCQSTNRDGGSIIGNGRNATIKGNIFQESHAERDGGAICMNGNDVENVVIEDNIFYIKNSAGGNGDNIWIRGINNQILNNYFHDPTFSSMGIYEQNPGSVILDNNHIFANKYVIEVEDNITGFAGDTIPVQVHIWDVFDGQVSGPVTLYGYGDHTLINGSAMFTITLPSNPGVTETYMIYEGVFKRITIESVSNNPIKSINMDNDSDDIIITLASGATGSVIVNINGVSYSAEAVNGVATIRPAGLVNGEYMAIVLYSGDNTYSNEWTMVTVNVTHSPVYKITENKDITVSYTGKAPYKVLITKDGKPVGAGESVTVSFNGKDNIVKTDSKGYALLNLNSDAKIGTYDVKTTYNGVMVTNKVKITQIIKASDKKVKKSAKSTKVKVSLAKVDDKYQAGKKLTIKFNGKKYTVKTDKKGVATWKVKKSMLKKLKVGKKVQYTVSYGKDTLTKKLTIKK